MIEGSCAGAGLKPAPTAASLVGGRHCGAPQKTPCVFWGPRLALFQYAASSSGLERAVSTAMSSMRFFKQATPKRSGAALLGGQWKGKANALRVLWAGIVVAPAVRQRVGHNFNTPHKLRKPPPIGGRASENA